MECILSAGIHSKRGKTQTKKIHIMATFHVVIHLFYVDLISKILICIKLYNDYKQICE